MAILVSSARALLVVFPALLMGNSAEALTLEQISDVKNAVLELCRGGTLEGKASNYVIEGNGEVKTILIPKLLDAGAKGQATFSGDEWKWIKASIPREWNQTAWNECVNQNTRLFIDKLSDAEQTMGKFTGEYYGEVGKLDPSGRDTALVSLFVADSGDLTGTLQASGPPLPINGKISGNRIRFAVPIDSTAHISQRFEYIRSLGIDVTGMLFYGLLDGTSMSGKYKLQFTTNNDKTPLELSNEFTQMAHELEADSYWKFGR
jgi:hypothetical protein